MSDQTNGLRFDVYERVHLPDEVAAIDELEEIELVPRIQVIDQGDQAVLKGQLLLSGVYRGQSDSQIPLTLEHWIPVEITLPMNRIERLDDISIEIDNFDVDLLSPRTLNITGVLSLRGISAQPAQELEESWREEPFTVVHQREANDEEPLAELAEQSDEASLAGEQAYIQEQPVFSSDTWAFEEREKEADEESEAAVNIASYSSESLPASGAEGWLSPDSPFASTVQQQQVEEELFQQRLEQQREEQVQAEIQSILSAEKDALQEEEPESVYEQAFELSAEPIPEPEAAPEPEKQELRIAFSGKQPGGSGDSSVQDVGILTLLQTSRREQAAREAIGQAVAEEKAAEEARDQAAGDEIEWKRLFLGKQSEDSEFRKIRMCIVQKDETLDEIAVRYSLNPREIVIYNRLDESGLSEGQILYIPQL